MREILSIAFHKAGNIRKLEKITGIPRATLSAYHTENRLINLKNLEKIVKYLAIKFPDKEIVKRLPPNWKQVKGGKNSGAIRKREGTFEKQMLLCRKGSSRYMKLWHITMKKLSPEKYYSSQFEKFKKIGLYKFETIGKIKVRNVLEKEIGDILEKIRVDYKYETLVRVGKKVFFPDFFIGGKVIVECTMWRGFDKAIKLKEKIKYLEKKYKVYVVIPKTLNRYYKILNRNLVLGPDEFVPVAQTFPKL